MDGITKLASAKILQAILDIRPKRSSTKKEYKFNRDQAEYWIFGVGTDFEFWCDCAGRSVCSVRNIAKVVMKEGYKDKTVAGMGPRYKERKLYRERMKQLKE